MWQRNTEEERLLGVSLTGIYDNPLLTTQGEKLNALLSRLREEARRTNEEYAALLGIPKSAAITCVKPSGTVSQLVDSASGIHPRHSKYYIRRVRGDKKDPLTQFLIQAWNAMFEYAIWNCVCVPKYGWPKLKLEQCVDTMAVAAANNIPQSLDDAGAFLDAQYQKDPIGKRLIQKLCKPNSKGEFNNDPELLKQLLDY